MRGQLFLYRWDSNFHSSLRTEELIEKLLDLQLMSDPGDNGENNSTRRFELIPRKAGILHRFEPEVTGLIEDHSGESNIHLQYRLPNVFRTLFGVFLFFAALLLLGSFYPGANENSIWKETWKVGLGIILVYIQSLFSFRKNVSETDEMLRQILRKR